MTLKVTLKVVGTGVIQQIMHHSLYSDLYSIHSTEYYFIFYFCWCVSCLSVSIFLHPRDIAIIPVQRS